MDLGEHENDIVKSVSVAERKCQVLKFFGKFSIYYFCLPASRTLEIDTCFQPFMHGSLKGDSVDCSTLVVC